MGLSASYYRFNGKPQPTQSFSLMNYSNKELYNKPKTSETPQQRDMVFISGKSSEDIEKALEDAVSNNSSLIDQIAAKLDQLTGKGSSETDKAQDAKDKELQKLKDEYQKLLEKQDMLEKQLYEAKNRKITGENAKAKMRQLSQINADVLRLTKELIETKSKAAALKAEIEAREAEENKGSQSSSDVQDTNETTETVNTTETEKTKEPTKEEKIQEIKNKIEALKAEMAELAKQNKFVMAKSSMGVPYMKCVTPEINNKISMIRMQISSLQADIYKLENEDMFNDIKNSTNVSLSDIESKEAELNEEKDTLQEELNRLRELGIGNTGNTQNNFLWTFGQ